MEARETNVNHRIRTEDKVRFSQLAAYGSGGIIPVALFNIAGILVGLMGNISLGLSAFWLGVILIIPRLWDAFSDPIIGHLSDNTRTRWGRRRPYLLIGGLLVAVFFVVMWWIPRGDMVRTWFPTESGFQAFQLVYILVSLVLFYTATTIFEIPHGALGMEMTTDYHERTRLFSAKSFVGNIFAMSTPWLFALANTEAFRGTGGNEADGMRYVSILIAAILIPLSFWWFFSLREPGFVKIVKQKRTPFWKDMKRASTNKNFLRLVATIFTLAMGFNFVNLLGSYIPIFYVFGGDKVAGARLLGINGTIWAVTGVLAVFPLNWISPKLGKRNTLMLAMILMCLAQLSKIVCYNPHHPYLIIIPTVLLSSGMLFFFTLGSSMVGDICDEDELHSGQRTEGSYYSVYWWFIKLGTAFASFVAGSLIVLTLFDEIQVTKVDSLQGSIRELRSKVQSWDGKLILNGSNTQLLEKIRTHVADAMDEANEYLSYLENESERKNDKAEAETIIFQTRRQEELVNTMSATRSTVNALEDMQHRLQGLGPQVADSLMRPLFEQAVMLTLQSRLDKARMNAFELMTHLKISSLKYKKNRDHYDTLLQNITAIQHSLAVIDCTSSPDSIDKDLVSIEACTGSLTKQTPYTLLMMRVVEIGLPLLLSLVSFLFIFRYSLTEKRLQEIKQLLTLRNRKTSDG